MSMFPHSISIMVGGAVAHSAVAVRMVHGTVERETEKAVKVTNDAGSVWFPKRCLKPFGRFGDTFDLSRTFDRIASPAQWNAIDAMADIGGQSVDSVTDADIDYIKRREAEMYARHEA